MTDLQNNQVRFTNVLGDQLILGTGTPYDLQGMSFDGISTVRPGDQDALVGQISGLDTEGGRPVTFNVYFNDPDNTQKITDAEALDAFLPIGPDEFTVELCKAGVTRLRYVMARGGDGSVVVPNYDGTVQLRLQALDPRKYGDLVAATVDAAETVVVGGLRASAAWLFTVDGPCTAPRFTAQQDTASVFEVSLPAAVIADGEQLQLDGRHDEVRVLTTAGDFRYDSTLKAVTAGSYTALLLPIMAGSTDCTFTSSSGATTGTLNIRPAY